MRVCAPITPPPAFRTDKDAGSHDFAIVPRAAHVVCVHAAATRAADGDQIVRSRAVRSQCHAEGRCLTQTAYAENETAPLVAARSSNSICGQTVDVQFLKPRLLQPATECNRKKRFFGQGLFCLRHRLKRQGISEVPQRLPRTATAPATMPAPREFRTHDPVPWTSVPAATRAVAPGAVLPRSAPPATTKAVARGAHRPGARAPGERHTAECRRAEAGNDDSFPLRRAERFHQHLRGRCLTRTA